eukprot:c36147_g1_i1 orf=2-154(-)
MEGGGCHSWLIRKLEDGKARGPNSLQDYTPAKGLVGDEVVSWRRLHSHGSS